MFVVSGPLLLVLIPYKTISIAVEIASGIAPALFCDATPPNLTPLSLFIIYKKIMQLIE